MAVRWQRWAALAMVALSVSAGRGAERGGGGGGHQPTENHVLRAVPAPGAVKLDGDLKDWD
ncbi:MAG: hypothetical protein WCI73_02580, partial [Phycisphaerae bacterium]